MRLWNSAAKGRLPSQGRHLFTAAAAHSRVPLRLPNRHPELRPIQNPAPPYPLQYFSTSHNLPLAQRYSSHSVSTMAPLTRHRRYSTSAVAVETVPSFAFAFDIDGVLLRSSAPIPGATEALAYLHNNHIPFILLTNGGGKLESTRVAELSKKLGVPLTEENFVQSHTPFKQLVDGSETIASLKDKTIFVTGGDGDKCRTVAEHYGFNSVVTSGDIITAYPTIWPFNQIWTDYYSKTHRPLPRPIDHLNPKDSLKIDAVFVFNDPRDWALDSQIILDLLLSKDGVLGTYSEKNGDHSLPNNGWQQDGQPKLFFSHNDLFWSSEHHMPRLGQGGFKASLKGIWDATTDGAALEQTVIGKPYPDTYKYAERVLNKHRAQMFSAMGESKKRIGRLERVFMVGDNPESDIRGANEFVSIHGTDWSSILVKSGVYREGTKPKYAPRATVKDVLEAVKWALKEEGWNGDLE